MRTIAGHHDSSVLEDRLVALVREVKERDPAGAFAPVLIVAPTRRLIAHLQVRLAEAFPALLNLHFFHHDSLADYVASRPGSVAALDADRVDFFHAQGVAAELGEIALRILTLHHDHRVPLGRIAAIARSLEPYAPLLRPVFTAHGSPFTTSACLGALREARAQASFRAYTGHPRTAGARRGCELGAGHSVPSSWEGCRAPLPQRMLPFPRQARVPLRLKYQNGSAHDEQGFAPQ